MIADSTKNRYVHNRTEGFPCSTWFCRVIRPVNSTVCKFISCHHIGDRVILKLENTKHTFLFMRSTRFWSEYAFLCCHFTEKLQRTLSFSCLACTGLYFSQINSYRQQKIMFYDKIVFLLSTCQI